VMTRRIPGRHTYRVAWMQGTSMTPCARMHGDDLQAAIADFEATAGDPYVRAVKLEQYRETGHYVLSDGGKVQPTYSRQTLRKWRRDESAPLKPVIRAQPSITVEDGETIGRLADDLETEKLRTFLDRRGIALVGAKEELPARPRLSLFALRTVLRAYDDAHRLVGTHTRIAARRRLEALLAECGIDLHTDT
jgi:hypothetical protein